jgi:fimbrial chaperone protein
MRLPVNSFVSSKSVALMISRHSIAFSAIAMGIAAFASIGTASASVTLPNTRVIYDGGAREQSLQFTNQDDGPSVMQVWVDSGDEHSTPKTANAPFIVTPPVFRIEPHAGQTARLVFTGADLPQDRESVFYLNTLQVPSANAAYADQNQMMVMLRNRLKIFYRPRGIEGRPQNAADKLAFSVLEDGKRTQIAVSNASGYHVSLVGGELACGPQTAKFSAGMIAPRSDAQWDVKGSCPASATPARVKVHYVDDYGAFREADYPVAAGSAK